MNVETSYFCKVDIAFAKEAEVRIQSPEIFPELSPDLRCEVFLFKRKPCQSVPQSFAQ